MTEQKRKAKVFGRINSKELLLLPDAAALEADESFQNALREAARVASLSPEEWEAEKRADALAKEEAKKRKNLELLQNRRDFIVLLREILQVADESEWPHLPPSVREFQKRKEALIQRLVFGPMPCPLDTCARPYRHSARVVESCIKRPSIFCNPNYLLAFLQREVRINELTHSLERDSMLQQAAVLRVDKLMREFQVNQETAKKVVSQELFEPKLPFSLGSFDPLMQFRLKEYVGRQTI